MCIISIIQRPLVKFENTEDPFSVLLGTYKYNPSILAILGNQFENIHSLRNVSEAEVVKEIVCMNDKKASQQSDISTKVIDMNTDIFSYSFNKNK